MSRQFLVETYESLKNLNNASESAYAEALHTWNYITTIGFSTIQENIEDATINEQLRVTLHYLHATHLRLKERLLATFDKNEVSHIAIEITCILRTSLCIFPFVLEVVQETVH